MRRYLDLIRTPGVAPLLSGLWGLAIGVTAPLLGRAVDRLGQTRVLVTTACVRERVDTAFAFDALQLELFFITGPLIVVAIAGAVSPQAAFLTAAVMSAAGAIGFAGARASRRWRPGSRDARDGRSALSAPGMRLLIAAFAISGVSLGALEIAIPAFAEQEGSRTDSGWLFALWALGSLVGGLWYGARSWRLPAARRFLLFTGVLALGLIPLPFAGSMLVFAAMVVVAGLGLAPSTAAAYSLIGELSPEGATTESYGWQIVGYVMGGALGAWLGGIFVDELSVTAALALAPATAGCTVPVALAGVRSWAAGS